MPREREAYEEVAYEEVAILSIRVACDVDTRECDEAVTALSERRAI
jgi:hypothetical protein